MVDKIKEIVGEKDCVIITNEMCLLNGSASDVASMIMATLSEMGKEMKDDNFVIRFAQAILAVYGGDKNDKK